MIEAVQEILHGITGQSLILDVNDGRPSSVTSCTVVEAIDDDTGPTESAIAAPAIETNPNTTTSAAAGASQSDPKSVSLTSATGVAVGRSFVITAAAGHFEMVEVVGISGTTATLRHPLINDYASGSTFQSTRITAAVDASWVAAEDNLSDEESTAPRYRAFWVYTLGGAIHRRATSFDLVRYAASHNVTPIAVDRDYPGWIDMLPVDYRREQGRPLIDQAFVLVKMDLRGDAKLARWARHTDVMSELVKSRANVRNVELAVQRGMIEQASLDAADKAYRQRYNQLVREPHMTLAVQAKGGEKPDGARRAPLFMR